MGVHDVNRRGLLRAAAAAGVVLTVPLASATRAAAAGPALGQILDYAGGIPSATAIRAGGYAGAIRYVSDRRPGGESLIAKPLLAPEVQALHAAGLTITSNYQFGKDATSDWLWGYAGGFQHARRGAYLHTQAGGPATKPIYVSIDSDPTDTELTNQVIPYLQAWNAVIGVARTGVYANSGTIDRALAAGVATWFWQHDWGTPKGFVHPAAHLHQIPGEQRVDNVGVDVNDILKPDYGQW